MGIGSFIGLFNNNLNNNIPFLLLGLGVDDSFVLSSEFKRATRLMPGASIEERIGVTMRTGGVSILITSVRSSFWRVFDLRSVRLVAKGGWLLEREAQRTRGPHSHSGFGLRSRVLLGLFTMCLC
jgi:hypothetical protein